jgi:hypothetical protein
LGHDHQRPQIRFLRRACRGDGRIRDAHRESVNETLKEFEKYLQARGGGPPSRHDFCPNRSGYVKPLK